MQTIIPELKVVVKINFPNWRRNQEYDYGLN
jgi:hypothetical protein